jgi:hypothetical protein
MFPNPQKYLEKLRVLVLSGDVAYEAEARLVRIPGLPQEAIYAVDLPNRRIYVYLADAPALRLYRKERGRWFVDTLFIASTTGDSIAVKLPPQVVEKVNVEGISSKAILHLMEVVDKGLKAFPTAVNLALELWKLRRGGGGGFNWYIILLFFILAIGAMIALRVVPGLAHTATSAVAKP